MLSKRTCILIASILLLTSPVFANSTTPWKEVKSCIDLGKQLQPIKQNFGELQNDTFSATTKQNIITPLSTHENSDTILVDHNPQKRTLTLIQGPQDPKTGVIDMNSIKKIGRFKLPKSFTNIQSSFFGENIFIIAASKNQGKENEESIVLFYQIENNKISPLYTFQQGATLTDIQIHNEKLYLILKQPLPASDLQAITRLPSGAEQFLPNYSEGLSYTLNPTKTETIACQDIKTLFSQDKKPVFWNIIVIDLKNIKSPKTRLTLLGNFDQFTFTENAIYASTQYNKEESLITRFGLEPKLNLQSALSISGEVVKNGIIDRERGIFILTKQTSGKINKYLIHTPNELSNQVSSSELLTGTTEIKNAQLQGNSLLIQDGQKQTSWIAQKASNGNFISHTPISIPSYTYLLQTTSSSENNIKIEEKSDQVLISELTRNGQNIQETPQKYYQGTSKTTNHPIWHQASELLLLPIQIIDQGNLFTGIKGLKIKNGKVQEFRSRSYPKQEKIEKISSFGSWVVVQTTNLIDIFLPELSDKYKVYSRK